MKNKSIIVQISFIITLVLLLVSSCNKYEVKPKGKLEKVTFANNGNTLAGSLLYPKGNVQEPFPVIIFVHGDGAQDRFGNGAYTILMDNFSENGIGVFSWDKPGVGESTGNWLHQSMEMRAEEAIAASNFLRQRKEIKQDGIGFIGFSQAGWVLPEMAKTTNDMAYMIIVGGAINWMEQKDFFESNQLKILGNIPHEEASADRKIFINLNKNSDAKEGLAKIKVPFLGIVGEKDLNVNSANTVAVYDSIFRATNHQNYQIKIFSNATHALLNADDYNFIGEWTKKAEKKYIKEGKNAFAHGYLELLTTWIQNH